MSQNISILQIEDSAEIQTGFRNVLAQVSNGTSAYLPQTANLGEFAARLRSDTAFSRFILDGRFPLSHEDPIGFYLPRALRLIQASQIKVDRIVIYSGEDMARLQ